MEDLNDIYSQLAKSLRTRVGVDPMNKLRVQKVLAAGQSQSASKLDTYVRTVQPTAGVIDGFLIHGGGSKTWNPPPTVPVLNLLSEAHLGDLSQILLKRLSAKAADVNIR